MKKNIVILIGLLALVGAFWFFVSRPSQIQDHVADQKIKTKEIKKQNLSVIAPQNFGSAPSTSGTVPTVSDEVFNLIEQCGAGSLQQKKLASSLTQDFQDTLRLRADDLNISWMTFSYKGLNGEEKRMRIDNFLAEKSPYIEVVYYNVDAEGQSTLDKKERLKSISFDKVFQRKSRRLEIYNQAYAADFESSLGFQGQLVSYKNQIAELTLSSQNLSQVLACSPLFEVGGVVCGCTKTGMP